MKGIMICEGEFEGVVEKPTEAEFRAFAEGFNTGANKYGAGSAMVVSADDVADLWPGDREKIAAMIKKHLG